MRNLSKLKHKHPSAGTKAAQLRLLQTTDLHGHVLAFDYHRDAPTKAHGLSRTATLIAKARATSRLSFLFDSGDFLQGSPLSDRLAISPSHTAAPPIIEAMNHLGFDAVTLGNHDLDFGPNYLASVLRYASFPVVCANITAPAPLQKYIKPFALLSRKMQDSSTRLTVGVTGCLPRDALIGTAGYDASIAVKPVRQALQSTVSQMRQLGADIIVVLAHCGFGCAREGVDTETINNTIRLVDGIDAVLGGHSHEVYPPSGSTEHIQAEAEPAVVLAGARGNHLGQVDFWLQRSSQEEGAANWKVAKSATTTHPVSQSHETAEQTPEHKDILRKLGADHDATRAALDAPIGRTEEQIDSLYSHVRNDAGLQLVAHAFEDKIRQLVAGTSWAGLPVLSATAPLKTGQLAGADNFCLIRKGVITQRDLSDLYGFSDRLCAISLNGIGLRAWLELSASVFRQIRTGTHDTPLLDSNFPGYLFDVIPQLTYAINLAKPAGYSASRLLNTASPDRIENLCYQGQPVRNDDQFLVALNSFRAFGHWPQLPSGGLLKPQLVIDSKHRCTDVISAYIRAHQPVPKHIKKSWSFIAQPDTSTVFLTAPQARHRPIANTEFLRLTPEGFAEMRLSLGPKG